jgi:Starch synthase catalytic domain
VVFGLSRELELRGNAVEIILPKYDCMRYDQFRGLQVTYQDLWVPWFNYHIHCTVYFGHVHGRKCFFIDPHSRDNFFSRGAYYTGGFLDERVNQERTQFNFDESIVEQIVRACSEHVRSNAIHAEIGEFDAQRLGTMREFVQDYPSFAFEEAEELLNRTPKNAVKAEQFAQALIPIRIRRDKERNATVQQILAQISAGRDLPADFAAAVRRAANEIKAEEQRQLTEYVMRRKTVLDVLDVLIRRIRARGNGTQDFHLESALHQFICPMKLRGDYPSKVERSDHDLWVIDERLTFTKYFASDVPFTQILEGSDSTRRPDVMIYDRLHGLGADGEDPLKRVLLVEFKQPGRRDYDERYSPMNQISEYITRLKNGEIEDFRNSRVRVADDCVFYCYVIADIVGKLSAPQSRRGQGQIGRSNGEGRLGASEGGPHPRSDAAPGRLRFAQAPHRFEEVLNQ